MKNTTFILCCLFCAALLQNAQAQSPQTQNPRPRYLREVRLSGSGYALGLQHGQQLKKEIGEIVAKWKKSVENELKQPADTIVKQFFAYARFDEAIKKWTPELYEEVRGIADGSGQAFNDIMVHNLLDEFWVWQDARAKHHCSGIGVPSRDGQPGYIAQNMDLEGYTDGYQVLLHLAKTDKTPEQLILTYPGLIATNGLNEAGIGACMNTLMQLKASPTGLPVAFIVRRILSSTDKDEVLRFIQTVPHASGQNYIIGIREEVYDFEASANKVVRFDPQNANGTVYHTNHPVANDDLKGWYKEPAKGNSAIRFASVQGRMAGLPSIKDADIKAALRAKDDPGNPVCRTFNRRGGTFGSVVMTLTGNPKLQITAGPPDESEYKEVQFSTGKTLPGEEGWRTIVGKVATEANEPLGYVMIRDRKNGMHAGADSTGKYAIRVLSSCQELFFDYDNNATVSLTTSDTLNLIMVWHSEKVNLTYRVKRSQPTQVSGKVRVSIKDGIRPSVRIKGSETKIYADDNGYFALTVPPKNDILIFECDKYTPHEVLLGDQEAVYVSVNMWPEYWLKQPGKKWFKFWKN